MILKDVKKLELSYIPEKILCREEELQRLKILMRSGRAIISGGVGTGKTLIARYIGGDAYINCYINKTEHRVLEEILNQIKPRFNPAGLPTQKLWNEIESGKQIILDEIDGMHAEELRHFAYTLSRQYEIGKKINYIAITRNSLILKQIINDDAIWSTFADNAIIELKPYNWEQLKEILQYRVEESLRIDACDDEIISLIADISLHSPGHMRTGIDLLRNSAIIAESRGHDKIEAEDVREANREELISDIHSMEREEAIVLLAVALACKNKAYADMKDIKGAIEIKKEEYGIKMDENKFNKILQMLIQQDFIYEGKLGYSILNCPTSVLIKEIEGRMNKLE